MRQTISIPLGAGLDRATGAGLVDAHTLEQARNVFAREASLQLRPGFAGTGQTAYNPAEATNFASDVILTQSVAASKHVIQVTYDRTTRLVNVWCINPSGTTKQFVALWGTLNASALFPVITCAESYGKLFLAHAEPTQSFRLATKYWAPGALDSDAGTLTALQADLDSSGAAADIKFYTVCAHGGYLAGAGWGTETSSTTSDRPEIVRLSVGADPLTFKPETYFICGPRGERIEALASMTDGLIAAGARMRHVVLGSAPADFGSKMIDPLFGCTSPRAIKVIGNVAYMWSAQGPRSCESALLPSTDLAIPLEVFEAQPSGTTASGEDRLRFAAYDPEARLLYFVAPDITLETTFAYLASLRNPLAVRWSDTVFARCLLCAGTYYTGKVTPPTGTGYAIVSSVVDNGFSASVPTGRRVTISWTNTTNFGDETVQLWQKVGAAAWAQVATFAVNGVGTAQTRQVTALDPLQLYAFAIRLQTSSGGYTVGYTQATPDLWSAGTAAAAQGTVTTGCATPTIGTASYARTGVATAIINVTWTIAETHAPIAIERKVGAGAYVEIEVVDGSTSPTNYTYSVDPSEIGSTLTFRVRGKRGADVSSYSGTVAVYAGYNGAAPGTALSVDVTAEVAATVKTILMWIDGSLDGANVVEVEEVGQVNVISGTLPAIQPGIVAPVLELGPFASVVAGASGTFTYRVRAGLQNGGGTDWGPWSSNRTQTCDSANSLAAYEYPESFYGNPYFNGDFAPGTSLPRDMTPSQLLFLDYELWLLITGTGFLTSLVGPIESIDNLVRITIDPPPYITINRVSCFIRDTTLQVRGPVTDVI